MLNFSTLRLYRPCRSSRGPDAAPLSRLRPVFHSSLRWTRLFELAASLTLATLATVLLALVVTRPVQAEEFLDADAAFKLQPRVADGKLSLEFQIAHGYYLYRERFDVAPVSAAGKPVDASFPKGQIKHDPTFDKDMEVYHDPIVVGLSFDPATPAGDVAIKVSYQGCAEAGLCYPPQTHYLTVTLGSGAQVQAVAASTEKQAQTATSSPDAVRPGPSDNTRIQATLKSGNLLAIAGTFVVFGLLLSFTPCVLPMVPILSSIIVGQQQPVSRSRGFGLALAYSLGMALVYTVFGVIAGLLGEGLAAALQNPWVLGAFGMLLVGLSLSMFGAYNLQLPNSWQAGISQASGRLRTGSYVGVLVMGGLSALIIGPCVAAPLAGALVYISQTRDVLIGGVALFSLALGMSVPLLLVGLSAGALLPRTGAWMESVKTVFGMLLLAVAWWLVKPVLPQSVALFLLGVWFALGAAFLGAYDTLHATASLLHRSFKGLGLVLALIGAAQIVGALAGADDPLQPLTPLTTRATVIGTANNATAAEGRALPFQRIASNAELDAHIRAAAGKPVMLDFYADWCVSCKEMERYSFSDARVQAKLAGVVLLQADVTANNAEHKALMKRFGLFGPPGILFFDAQGQEIAAARVIGFQKPEDFLVSLGAAQL